MARACRKRRKRICLRRFKVARPGGFGLGLAIAAELMRGHGGKLILSETGASGTRFALHLPKGVALMDAAAE